MPSFGDRSKKNLSEAHPLLQELFEEVVKHYDCAVIEGHRPKEEQDKAFHGGKSKVQWPNSKHNQTPSLAVDVCPFPINWKDTRRFYYFAGHVMATARVMGIDLRWGGDWNGNNEFKDQSFHDLPHFELRSTARQGRTTPGTTSGGQPVDKLPEAPTEAEISESLQDLEDDFDF